MEITAIDGKDLKLMMDCAKIVEDYIKLKINTLYQFEDYRKAWLGDSNKYENTNTYINKKIRINDCLTFENDVTEDFIQEMLDLKVELVSKGFNVSGGCIEEVNCYAHVKKEEEFMFKKISYEVVIKVTVPVYGII